MAARVDTHVHVFDPDRFAFAQDRRFTPGPACVGQLSHHLSSVGLDAAVLVQPSVYGTDHACLLDALQALEGRARGVGVIDHSCPARSIDCLQRAGVMGARINLAVRHVRDPALAAAAIRAVANRIPREWHIQLHLDLDLIHDISHLIEALPQHVVIDHFGLPRNSLDRESPGWASLTSLVARHKASVKLSAPYLFGQGNAGPGAAPARESSDAATDYALLRPFVLDLAAASPQGILWGSNWPHTQGTARPQAADTTLPEPFRTVDDGLWLRVCSAWLSEGGYSPDVPHLNAHRIYAFEGLGRNRPSPP